MPNIDHSSYLWTSKRHEYILVKLEEEVDDPGTYAIVHVPTKQYLLIEDYGEKQQIVMRMIEANVRVYQADEMKDFDWNMPDRHETI